MKVLLAACACNPREGSEAAVGWTWLAAIKDRHDVHVITAEYQQDWIEAEIRKRPGDFSRVRFHYVELRFWQYAYTRGFCRWQMGMPLLLPLFHCYYQRWMRAAYATACDLNRQFHFDLAHQLTLVGFRFPGHLWKLGIPFVWGPIGGLENTPWRFFPELGVGGAAHYALRNAVNSVHRVLLQGPRKAFAAAGPGVIAATGGIRREIGRWYGVDSEVICEIGLPAGFIASACPERGRGEPLRLAWSGLHQSRKALPILLRALAALPPEMDWRLDIFGDGPCRRRWHALASGLGLQSRCTWHGQVSRAEALAGLRKAHVFVITSLQDLTSTVLVEALANGVPVICPDHCGFSDALTPASGVKLPITSLLEFQEGLRSTILDLYQNEEKRRRLAGGALRRARDFSWEAKVAAINRVYERVLEARVREPRGATAAVQIDASVHS